MVAKKKVLKKPVKKIASIEAKSKEALKAVDILMRDVKKNVFKDFGKVKIKYKEGAIVKKMRKNAALKLKELAFILEGKSK